MRVAEIQITISRSIGSSSHHVVGFDNSAKAKEEYDRIVENIKRRIDRQNDVDKVVRLVGITEFTCGIDDVASVSFADLAIANDQEAYVRNAFPNLYKR